MWEFFPSRIQGRGTRAAWLVAVNTVQTDDNSQRLTEGEMKSVFKLQKHFEQLVVVVFFLVYLKKAAKSGLTYVAATHSPSGRDSSAVWPELRFGCGKQKMPQWVSVDSAAFRYRAARAPGQWGGRSRPNQSVNYFTRWLEIETFRVKNKVSSVCRLCTSPYFEHCWPWRCHKGFVLKRKQVSSNITCDLCSICTRQSEHEAVFNGKILMEQTVAVTVH